MAAAAKLQDKKVILVLLSLVALMVVLLSLFGDKGFLQLQLLKEREAAMIEEISEIHKEQEIWKLRLEALHTNPSYLETLAREELGLVRSNEKIILTLSAP